jgi:dethiobiotin synthetase
MVVSGTGTGVGKTVVTAAVCALARERGTDVAVVKPVQTGTSEDEPGDLAEIARLCRDASARRTLGRLTLVEGARFPHPLSPAAAARASGRPPVDLSAIAAQVAVLHESHRLVLIEGAGGLLVRYDEEGATVAALAGFCAADVLVVTEAGLGALNATALTLEALAHRGLQLAGLVIGSWPGDPDLACASNVADFEMLAARPLAGALPAGAGHLTSGDFAATASASLAPALGGRFDAATFRAAASALAAETLGAADPGAP